MTILWQRRGISLEIDFVLGSGEVTLEAKSPLGVKGQRMANALDLSDRYVYRPRVYSS